METSSNGIILQTSRPELDDNVHNDSDLPRWTPSVAAVTFKPGQAFFSGRNPLKLWPQHHLSTTATGPV